MSTVIRNVLPMGGAEPVDIVVRDGLIAAMGVGTSIDAADEVFDGSGQVAFPGLIDAHTHMEKTLLGLPWHINQHGPTLLDHIENERRIRREENIDFVQQVGRHARAAIADGTTHIRTHSDIDTEIGLSAFEGALQTRQDLKGAVTIQTVAFPQSGMLVRPGTVELLEEALKMGADVMGGLDPCSVDKDPKGHLDTIFALATKYDVDIDIHVHEGGELGAFSIDLILDRVETLGYQGRVVISHAFALAIPDAGRWQGLVDRVVRNDVTIMSHGPGGLGPAPSIKRLRDAGVRLCAGNDGILDAWNPLQRPDMLERAYIMCYRNGLRRDDDIDDVLHTVTYDNARVVGAENYGLAVGKSADIVVVPAVNHIEAMVVRRPRSLVMKAGRITARNGECIV